MTAEVRLESPSSTLPSKKLYSEGQSAVTVPLVAGNGEQSGLPADQLIEKRTNEHKVGEKNDSSENGEPKENKLESSGHQRTKCNGVENCSAKENNKDEIRTKSEESVNNSQASNESVKNDMKRECCHGNGKTENGETVDNRKRYERLDTKEDLHKNWRPEIPFDDVSVNIPLKDFFL